MNPYSILDIEPDASTREIIQASARAMRERKYTGKEIAIAQKKLMDPISRSVEHFICFLDVSPFLEAWQMKLNSEHLKPPVDNETLKYLPVLE